MQIAEGIIKAIMVEDACGIRPGRIPFPDNRREPSCSTVIMKERTSPICLRGSCAVNSHLMYF